MNDFCLKQSQGFKASAAHLYQNFLRVPSPSPPQHTPGVGPWNNWSFYFL